MLDPDRHLPQTLARRVKDRVGDRRRRADHRDLAKTLGANGVGERIGPIHKADVNLADIGVCRHDVVCEVIVEPSTVAWINLRASSCLDGARLAM